MTFGLAFLGTFLVLSIIVALIVYGIGNAIKKQAQKENPRFFGPVPRPGSFSFASNAGSITDILENVVGWNLRFNPTGDRRLFYKEKHVAGFWETQLGVRWLGIYPTIRTFSDYEWSEIQEKEAMGTDGKKTVRYEIVPRKGNLTDFFFQFSHPVRMEAIEIKGNIQVVVTMLVTVLNLDPERAQFLNKDPAILLAAILQSTVRAYICDMEFEEVKRMTGTNMSTEDAQLWETIKSLNGLEMDSYGNPLYETEDPLGIFGKLGKYVVRAEILQVDAVGAAAQAIEAKRLAELRGDAAIAEATKKGEAEVIAAEKRAEATRKEKDARKEWVQETIVGPIVAGGPGVASVLEAEKVASADSKVSTWVKGGQAVVSVKDEKSS